MRIQLLILLFIFSGMQPVYGQTVNFEDGFEDGDFSNDPIWAGDTADFIVTNIDDNHILQLNAGGSGTSYLSVPSSNIEGSWEFYIKLDFAPSDGNRAYIFLMSDTPDLGASPNGYAIRAGENGSDDLFHLVKFRNGSEDSVLISGTTDISSGGDYRVKVTRDGYGNWILETGQGYDGKLLTEGTGYDDDQVNATHFGILLNYTTTRSDKFYFDFKIDLPPFAITDVSVSDHEIDLTFNRSYDQSTVQASDFLIDNGFGSPDFVSFIDEKTIRISYGSRFPSGKYTLTLNTIKDENGEIISPDHKEFHVFDTPSSGDVVINEFMYDPPAGLEEYVELRNISGKYLNLQGWTLSDNRDIRFPITSEQFILPPGNFAVLAPDNSLLQEYPDIALISMGSSFPALNNGGDDIVIHRNDGMLLDSLRYKSSWGGNEIALERRTTDVKAIYPENWGDSPGTPGFQNSIQMDRKAPEFQEVTVVDPSTLQLHFSERLTTSSATDIGNYSVSPVKEIRTVSFNIDTVTLYLSERLDSGHKYQVTVKDLKDLFGNKISSQIQEVDYLKISQPDTRDLVINEIMYKRSSDGGPEFVEFYNTSDKNFILDGWTIGDAAGTATLVNNILFPAGDFLVLTDDRNFAENDIKIHHLPNFPSLNDAGDILYIRNENGLTIDSLHYKSSWGGNLSGISLERKDPGSASNDASNWYTSSAPAGSTPGRKNAGFEIDVQPPEVIFSKHLDSGEIEVHFNEFIKLTEEVEFLLGVNRLNIAKFNPLNGNRIILSLTKGKSKDNNAVIAVNNLSDVRGNITESSQIAVSQPLQPGDLVINEIMYNPLSDNEDNLPDQSEYIELRNITEHAISLEGVQLHDAPDENNNLRILTPVNTTSQWIPSQGSVLVYSDESSGFTNSKVARFFDLNREEINSPLRVDRTTLSLASTGDAIYIADSTGTTIDSVFYDESWQNPNLIDTRGIALERINPAGPGNEASNWGSSISEKGGTPGTENSIYQTPENVSTDLGISFSPNPFSPDDDGYEDNLFIRYVLDAADYLTRVRIYDRYGRLVRKLEDGKPAGFEGTIMWDGRRDDGSRNRIGIYIVVFEAYDSSTGKNKAFKETVVLARRL